LGSEARVTGEFWVCHGVVLFLLYMGLSLLLGARHEGRAAAAAFFLMPVMLALWPLVHAYGQTWRWFLALASSFAAGAGLAWLAWARGLTSHGWPLLAAAVGSIIGCELTRFRVDEYRGFATGPGPLLRIVGESLASLVVAVLPPPRSWAIPGRMHYLAVATAAIVGAIALGPLETRPALEPPAITLDRHRPPVVLIVLDTLRADHLQGYGYHRATMPRLNEFARREAVQVINATSNAPWTPPTHGSLFTGLYPPRHGAHGFHYEELPSTIELHTLPPDVPTLSGLLSDAGYWTVGIVANHAGLAPATGLGRGFRVYGALPPGDYTMKVRSPWTLVWPFASLLQWVSENSDCPCASFFARGVPYRRAERITDEAIAAVDAGHSVPFFLFVNYMDAHWPYDPPYPYRVRFPGRHPMRELGGPESLHRATEEVLKGAADFTPALREHLIALYDGGLAYLDDQLARLLQRLREHPRWRDMLVVVTSDHGEAIGEHRYLYHGRMLYDELLSVPLIVKPGGARSGWPSPGQTIAGPVQSVDVFSTILEFTGITSPAFVDGTPWGRGRSNSFAWEYLDPLARTNPRFARELRSVQSGRWKLIQAYPGQPELYDLESDPDEFRNLAPEQPERVRELTSMMMPRRPGTRRESDLDEETREKLRALGYLK
jgi:arylsulfatase A-like enzyme